MAVAVQALPPYASEPLPEWETASGQPELSLVLEFPNLYRRLPPGIPAWGIARAHRFSLRKPWRNLALFIHRDRTNKSSLGIIHADEPGREVYVRVRSHHPPYLHSILRDVLDDTIRRYPGLEVRESVPCRCQPDCPDLFPLNFLVAKQERQEAYVDCRSSSKPQRVIELLTGLVPAVPFPARPGSEETVLAEIRRRFTAQFRGLQNLNESTCPNVFQLHPRRDFQTFEGALEYLRKGEKWPLSLYCEADEEWHTAGHGVYDFDLLPDWVEGLRPHWNALAEHMRLLAPYLKAGGKLSGTIKLEALGPAAERLPNIPADSRELLGELGEWAVGTGYRFSTRCQECDAWRL